MDKTPEHITSYDQLETVTGVQLMQGIGHKPVEGFWTEAWNQVVRRPGAIMGLIWVAIVGFFACFAPVIANGHPILMRELNAAGEVVKTSSPMLANFTSVDILLIIGGVLGPIWLLGPWKIKRSDRLAVMIASILQSGLIAVIAMAVGAWFTRRDASVAVHDLAQAASFVPLASAIIAGLFSLLFLWLMPIDKFPARLLVAVGIGLVTGLVVSRTWTPPLEQFEYRALEAEGKIRATYTILPFSSSQGSTTLDLKEPGASLYKAPIDQFIRAIATREGVAGFTDDRRWDAKKKTATKALADIPVDAEIVELMTTTIGYSATNLPKDTDAIIANIEESFQSGSLTNAGDMISMLEKADAPGFMLGTDRLGQDVMGQMIHACRLSISIGLVSTSIAVLIGVTMGAIMGYFGGWVDMVLYRVVEIFMAIPVLFLLIVAAAVLPRNTYVMMAIIGCFSWMGAARFIRAEFMKLRNMDFVQSARAVGLPLRSVLFKHMLPNGVTPVLVAASFAIAAAILFESYLSFLGLGPPNQASWGRLLAEAANEVGNFVPWLAIFPGAAIFLTVLAYNLIGEAFRDAIDPKLKKARV